MSASLPERVPSAASGVDINVAATSTDLSDVNELFGSDPSHAFLYILLVAIL